jgi:hypothetical protein
MIFGSVLGWVLGEIVLHLSLLRPFDFIPEILDDWVQGSRTFAKMPG